MFIAFSINHPWILLLITVVAQRASSTKNSTTASVFYALGSVISILLFFTCCLCLVRRIRNLYRDRSQPVYYAHGDPTTNSQINTETEFSNGHTANAPSPGQPLVRPPINMPVPSQRELEVQGSRGYSTDVSPPYSSRVHIQSQPVVHTTPKADESESTVQTRDQQLQQQSPLVSGGSQLQETFPTQIEVQAAETPHTGDRDHRAPHVLSSDTLSSQAVVIENPGAAWLEN